MVDVPQPPENPFMNENENGDHDAAFITDENPVESKPNVSARPERVFLVLFVVISILFFLGYLTLSGKKKDDSVLKKPEKTVANAPIEPPPLPENPILEPPPVIAPPPIPEPTKLDVIKPEEDSAAQNNMLERMRSKMMVSDGGGILGGAMGSETKEQGPMSNDPNSVFENNVVAATTQAARIEATHIGDLRKTIAQGRLIQATMESALNTDMPAPIRAIVSRDTYAEAGREPLIPKGSRLIGMYNTDISGGQARVFVVWIRVIRPDGVDIQLGSPLVDAIGQAGVGGVGSENGK